MSDIERELVICYRCGANIAHQVRPDRDDASRYPRRYAEAIEDAADSRLRGAVAAGDALADAIRAIDSYAALGGAPMERTERADAALRAWTELRGR